MASARRIPSWWWELPPSMTRSPASIIGARVSSNASTPPAGIMIQMLRGASRAPSIACGDSAPVAPSATSAATFAGSASYTTQRCPSPMRRRTMLAPMRPRPIMPSCIGFPLYKRSCMGAGDGLYSCPRRAPGHAVPCLRRLYHTRLSALADLNVRGGGVRRCEYCP